MIEIFAEALGIPYSASDCCFESNSYRACACCLLINVVQCICLKLWARNCSAFAFFICASPNPARVSTSFPPNTCSRLIKPNRLSISEFESFTPNSCMCCIKPDSLSVLEGRFSHPIPALGWSSPITWGWEQDFGPERPTVHLHIVSVLPEAWPEHRHFWSFWIPPSSSLSLQRERPIFRGLILHLLALLQNQSFRYWENCIKFGWIYQAFSRLFP